LADTARDSSVHLDAVERLIHLQDTDVIVALVDHLGIVLLPDTVSTWSVEDRAAVKAWAEAPTEQSPRPAILGTAHVAGGSITSEAEPGDTFQCCRECGARLLSHPTGSGEHAEFYPAGTLVGSDCPGAKEPARYAKRGKKKAKA
jgi:hypothetical protein